MKRSTKLTLPLMVLLIGFILTIGIESSSNTITKENTTYVVKFHITGCDACTGLTYCINGGTSQTVNSCTFSVDLPKGQNNICVHCPNNKWGSLNFTVQGYSYVQDEYMTVQNDTGQDCECSNNK